MATNFRLERTNKEMQPKGAPLQFAAADDGQLPSDRGRTAGVTILVGCTATVVATVLPAVETATVGVSLLTGGIRALAIPLAVVAVISAGIAGVVLLRRPATVWIAFILIVLAVAQLGFAVWFGSSIVLAIEQANSHLVLISAIGTGAYLSVVGSVITLVGAILAWTRRASALSMT